MLHNYYEKFVSMSSHLLPICSGPDTHTVVPIEEYRVTVWPGIYWLLLSGLYLHNFGTGCMIILLWQIAGEYTEVGRQYEENNRDGR